MERRKNPRELLALSLKELTLKKSFEDITITELTRSVGYSRKNFYYYFHDKYELIIWYFNFQGDHIIENNKGKSWGEILEVFLEDIMIYRQFYSVIYNDSSSYRLTDHYFDFIQRSMALFMQDRGKQPSEDDLFYIRYIAYGNTQVTRHWLMDSCRIPVPALARKMVSAYPEPVKKWFSF